VTDKKTKAALKKILEDKGFKVELIEETDESTPDVLASDSHTQLLIEIKERYGTDRSRVDGLDVRLDKVVRQNTLSGISKKAVEQLKSRSTGRTFNLLWLVADPADRKLHYEQFRMTTYGIRIVTGRRAGHGFAKECYYATYSDFYRWRDVLDGVALGNFGGVFVNDYSPRYRCFRATNFVKLFEPAVWEPAELEQRGDAFRLDADVDRSDEAAVKKAIEAKYGVEVSGFEDLVRFSA
jgi:hypothetical protein